MKKLLSILRPKQGSDNLPHRSAANRKAGNEKVRESSKPEEQTSAENKNELFSDDYNDLGYC